MPGYRIEGQSQGCNFSHQQESSELVFKLYQEEMLFATLLNSDVMTQLFILFSEETNVDICFVIHDSFL